MVAKPRIGRAFCGLPWALGWRPVGALLPSWELLEATRSAGGVFTDNSFCGLIDLLCIFMKALLLTWIKELCEIQSKMI